LCENFSEKSWYHRYFTHNSDEKAFEEIRKRLIEARGSLQLSLAVEQTKTLQSWKIAQETDQHQLDEMVRTLKSIEQLLKTGQMIKPESKGT